MTTVASAPAAVLAAAVNLYKAFPGTQALAGVSITIRKGEIVGIVGENGAGKSTLLKILAGIQQPDSGELWMRGERVTLPSVREATRIGINMVSQEGSLLGNLSVGENIFLGSEARFMRFGTIDWRRLHIAARSLLARVECDVDPSTETWRLSFSQRQMVALARVIALQQSNEERESLVILDEPTSVLTRRDVDRLFEIIGELRRYAAFVFVSHRLDEVLEITDRIYVLRDGTLTGELESRSTNAAELQRLMVGRELHHEYYREHLQGEARREVVLALKDLRRDRQFSGVSLEVHAGEVVGLCGAEGAGCEAVMRTVAGFQKPAAGTVALQAGKWSCSSPEEASRRGIGYVPSERGREGVIPQLSVAHNMTLPRLALISSFGFLSANRERSLVASWIEKLHIRATGPMVPVSALSGGNQQKTVLAKWLMAQAELLLLDHPTRGVDVGAKEEVYEIIRGLTAQGMAILLVADTLEEAIGLSHRLICMRDGEISAVLPAPSGGKPSLLTVLSHIV